MGQYIKESVKRKIRLLCARKNDTGLCKKYEPYILKYMARILKYMPYVFEHVMNTCWRGAYLVILKKLSICFIRLLRASVLFMVSKGKPNATVLYFPCHATAALKLFSVYRIIVPASLSAGSMPSGDSTT